MRWSAVTVPALIAAAAAGVAAAAAAANAAAESNWETASTPTQSLVLAPTCPPIIQQANCVSGEAGLSNHSSTATIKCLGLFSSPLQCAAACDANSTAADPCHSWAFYYPDSHEKGFQGSCYGRHDKVFDPTRNIPLSRNHVCTAVSCKYPVPPTPPTPAPPTPPPMPRRPASPVDVDLAPVAYLGGVDEDSQGPVNFTRVCKFQLVAVINAYCWQYTSTDHVNCTNRTNEAQYIINISRQLRDKCPTVLTQMYVNSMMNFWWYTDLYARFEGDNESLLLHDTDGRLVRVLQDGGNPNMTVFDFSQQATRDMFMAEVDDALASGVTSFFLDKASTTARGGQICNHVCDDLPPGKDAAWTAGHTEVLRAVAAKSTGPTVGNGGSSLCYDTMGGCHTSYDLSASGVQQHIRDATDRRVSSVFAQFPITTDGYAAFLQGYVPGRSWLWKYTSAPFWLPEFERPLGAPLGPATLSGGVYTRRFARGAVVTFDTSTKKGTFVWGKK